MSKKTPNNGILGPKALEMVMRDVLGGMEEFAVMKSYEVTGQEYKVIAIKPHALWASNDQWYEDEPQKNTIDAPKKVAEIIVMDEYLRRTKRKASR